MLNPTSSQSIPETSWVKQLGAESLGSASSDLDHCMLLDSDDTGNIYCAGHTDGDLGEPSAGGSDGILLKFNPKGDLLWIRQLGSVTAPAATGNEAVYSMDMDSFGNIIVIGTTTSSLTEPNAGGSDIFIVKFNSSGTLQWIKQFGATSLPTATQNETPSSVRIDSVGNFYISGNTNGSMYEVNGGGSDIFLMKTDSTGNPIWTKQFGSVTAPGAESSGDESCASLYLKSDNEIFCTGYTSSSFGEANGGNYDMFFMKFDTSGTVNWIKQLGSVTLGADASGNDICSDINIDSIGNVYCVGITSGNLGELNGGNNDIAIVKLNSMGDLTWISQLGAVTAPNGGSSGNDTCSTLKISNKDELYCSGMTTGSLGETFGGGTNNGHVIKMSSAGNLLWIKQFGAETFPDVTFVLANPCKALTLQNNQPICSGRTSSDLVETNTGNAGDIYLIKLKSDGTL